MATFWAVSCLIIGIAFAISERRKNKRTALLSEDVRRWRKLALDGDKYVKEAALITRIGNREDVWGVDEKVYIHCTSKVAATNIATMLSAAGYGDITEDEIAGWFDIIGAKAFCVFYPGDAS